MANSRLTTAHLPTGVVQLEDVLRLAIDGFGAQPVRPDWDEVLTVSKAACVSAWL